MMSRYNKFTKFQLYLQKMVLKQCSFIQSKYLILFVVIGLVLIGCNKTPTDTNGDLEEPIVSKTIGASGDTISIINNNGDEIFLLIPANAIDDNTTISLTALNSLSNDIFANTIPFGIRLEPDGLMLNEPVILKVKFASAISDTSSATLFNLVDNSTAYPLGNREVTNNSLSGEIYHFSEYGGSNPTSSEASQQAEKTTGSGAGPFDWQTTYDVVGALLWWGEYLIFTGHLEDGQKYLDRARDILKADAQNFLNQKIPDEPCGWYLRVALKYAEKVNLMVGAPMDEKFSDLLISLADKCLGRGQIQYDHKLSMSNQGYTEEWTITGLVDWHFTVFTYPYGDVSGSGTVELSRSGTAESCTFSGTASINVEISGTLEADEFAYLWLNVELEEDWPAYDLTYNCPDNVVVQVPQPAAGKQSHPVRLLLEEGWTYSAPAIAPGVSGTYNYIMHITRLP